MGGMLCIHKVSMVVTDAGVEERDVALDERSTVGLSSMGSQGFASRDRTELRVLAAPCRVCPQMR